MLWFKDLQNTICCDTLRLTRYQLYEQASRHWSRAKKMRRHRQSSRCFVDEGRLLRSKRGLAKADRVGGQVWIARLSP